VFWVSLSEQRHIRASAASCSSQPSTSADGAGRAGVVGAGPREVVERTRVKRMANDSSDTAPASETGDVLDPTGVLGELSRILGSTESLETVLEGIVALAKDRIPGADEVSITLVHGDRASTVASTGTLATEMDERQYASGWGPCLDSAEAGELLAVDDTATETRWPEFVAKGQELGVGSSISAPMPTQQHVGGALNTYARTPHAFGEPSRNLARSIAAHAALALAHAYRYASVAREAASLQEAMRSRAVIEQAKGMIMAVRNCSADDAFAILVRLSQTSNQKLRDVAAQTVDQVSGQTVNSDRS
jgi:transcriptional regulator with GAF, ATPase, and Fis domain